MTDAHPGDDRSLQGASELEFIGDIERAFATAVYPNRVVIAALGAAAVVFAAVVARRRRWDQAARRHPRLTAGLAVMFAVVGLPAAWYLASPLFISTTIDEPPPAAAAASPPRSAPPAALASPRPLGPTPIARSGEFAGADEFHFGRGTATLIETQPGHYVVRLEQFEVRNGPDLYVYLSPSPDGYAQGAIELGRLKADKGNQNYDVPADADVEGAQSVVVWCKQFAVLFATARLGG